MSTDHDPEELREHSHLNTTSTPSVVDEPLIPEFHLKGFEDQRRREFTCCACSGVSSASPKESTKPFLVSHSCRTCLLIPLQIDDGSRSF